jgi:hypothetical protein
MADNFNVLDHGAIGELLVDAKGDLLTATADNTPARLAVGTDGHVLKAASGQATGLQWAAATDTSTVPTADAATGSAGSSLTAAARDHVHPRTVWTAADYSYATMSFDPVIAVTSSPPSAAGTVQLTRLHLPVTTTITNIVMYVGTLGSGLTSGQNFAALYSAAGGKLDTTADQTTAWGSTGLKTMALGGGATSRAAGDYYVVVWSNTGTSMPQFIGRSGATAVNGGLASPNFRVATADTSITTSGPTNLGAQTAAVNIWWVALS